MRTSATIDRGSPPAIWASFVRQGRWKNYVLLAQLLVIAFVVAMNARLVTRAPDVVLLSPDGKSAYVPANVATQELVDFLRTLKAEPTDAGVSHFTREFLEKALALNSSTIREAWPEALRMTGSPLRERLEKETSEKKLVETEELARVSTALSFRELSLVQRAGTLLHVRAKVERVTTGLIDGKEKARDFVQVEMVEKTVPRTLEKPDGLEVVEWRVNPAPQETAKE